VHKVWHSTTGLTTVEYLIHIRTPLRNLVCACCHVTAMAGVIGSLVKAMLLQQATERWKERAFFQQRR
jgi:hypothetical protein